MSISENKVLKIKESSETRKPPVPDIPPVIIVNYGDEDILVEEDEGGDCEGVEEQEETDPTLVGGIYQYVVYN